MVTAAARSTIAPTSATSPTARHWDRRESYTVDDAAFVTGVAVHAMDWDDCMHSHARALQCGAPTGRLVHDRVARRRRERPHRRLHGRLPSGLLGEPPMQRRALQPWLARYELRGRARRCCSGEPRAGTRRWSRRRCLGPGCLNGLWHPGERWHAGEGDARWDRRPTGGAGGAVVRGRHDWLADVALRTACWWSWVVSPTPRRGGGRHWNSMAATGSRPLGTRPRALLVLRQVPSSPRCHDRRPHGLRVGCAGRDPDRGPHRPARTGHHAGEGGEQCIVGALLPALGGGPRDSGPRGRSLAILRDAVRGADIQQMLPALRSRRTSR